MERFIFCLLGIVVIHFACFQAAMAQTRQIKSFTDWEVICSQPNDTRSLDSNDQKGDKQEPQIQAGRCQASQKLGVGGSDTLVFAVTILKTDATTYAAIISFPLGGYLVPGVLMKVDQGKPYKVLVETCAITGCHAGFPLNGPLEKQWRKGKQAQFEIWSSKTKSTTLSISLNGLNDALNYIEHL